MKLLLIIFVILIISKSEILPVIFHHGIDANGGQFNTMISWIKQQLGPNTKTFSLNINNGFK